MVIFVWLGLFFFFLKLECKCFLQCCVGFCCDIKMNLFQGRTEMQMGRMEHVDTW